MDYRITFQPLLVSEMIDISTQGSHGDGGIRVISGIRCSDWK